MQRRSGPVAKGWQGFDPMQPGRRKPLTPAEQDQLTRVSGAIAKAFPQLDIANTARGPKTIWEMWDNYIKVVDPQRRIVPGGTQYLEMQRTWYAAFACLLDFYWMIGDDDVTEDQGVKFLESMRDEVREHQQRLIEGKA